MPNDTTGRRNGTTGRGNGNGNVPVGVPVDRAEYCKNTQLLLQGCEPVQVLYRQQYTLLSVTSIIRYRYTYLYCSSVGDSVGENNPGRGVLYEDHEHRKQRRSDECESPLLL